MSSDAALDGDGDASTPVPVDGGEEGSVADAGADGSGEDGSDGVATTIHNPVLPGYNADPQIAYFGGKFYIYPTTDGYPNWTSTSFSVFSSLDLASWRDEGVVLTLGSGVTWAQNEAWAPGITLRNGVYYFYFAAQGQIGVATSSSPTGPFHDALGHPLVKTTQYGVQSIDPYVFVDDDGRAYLYFGSGGARAVELDADMTSFKGTPQNITPSGFREASVMFKRNGIYYFMWSENDTRSATYHVSYGTGSSPLGPFTKSAVNPILQENASLGILATGHNSVLALPNGDYYIAYHRFAIPNGDGTHREVCLDRLFFNSDGTIVPVKPTL